MIQNACIDLICKLMQAINVSVDKQRKDYIMTIEKDRTMFGTKIYNYKTKEQGILLYTWTNIYADAKVPFATCVDENGKKYNIKMDNISPIED